MENNKILVQKEIPVEDIKRLIYEVRGTKILLDSDLAKLFGCKNGTKEINQAFKNNMDRFSKSCSWKLTLEEFYELQSKYLTANLSKMSRTTPRVFTEEGVTIISIILRNPFAKNMSNRIIEAFEEKNKMLVSGLESAENIRNLIYEVRGKQVMLDSDLALLYNCANKTKDINKAVNRNIDRFPKDFYFQLTLEEYSNLKFQNGTSSLDNNYGGVRKLPYVFTEGGVSMLASVLRTEVASKMSVAIIRTFISMKHYIGFNASRITNIETKVIEHDTQIKTLKETLDKFEEKKKVTETYFDGKIFDAYSKIYEIFSEAKKKLVIIDNYADIGLLDIIKRLNIKVVIVTKENNLLTKKDIENYNKQYHNLKVIYNSSFHDRYFILDDKIVYHCGASLNRIGYKTFSITLVNDNFLLESLLEKAKFV